MVQTPLLDSIHPIKLALFCLGSKGAAVIVGFAGTAATANAVKASTEKEYRSEIIFDYLRVRCLTRYKETPKERPRC
jgi:hypothetical protein